MPVAFLTDLERESLTQFPPEIPYDDIVRFFTLSSTDLAQVPKTSAEYNRLGFALQFCSLRYLGFCPADLGTIPHEIVIFVARQLNVLIDDLSKYGERDHTRTDHMEKIQDYLGFRKANSTDLDAIGQWLVERALEHDKPRILFQLACERLRIEKIIRPGITRLERLIATARNHAQQETFRRIEYLLTEDRIVALDNLLINSESISQTPLAWLRQRATSNTPSAILSALDKLAFLRQLETDKWDLSFLNPNRVKFLAQLGRKSTSQQLQQASRDRRYPILIAFLYQSLEDITDETIDLYCRCLARAYSSAGRRLDEFRRKVARATNEKVRLFQEVAHMVLDPSIPDDRLRALIYQRIPPEKLLIAVDECVQLIRPIDDNYFDFLADRYTYIRRFVPAFLEGLSFQTNLKDDSLLAALNLLRRLNTEKRRRVPDDAPLAFVPPKWHSCVVDETGLVDRCYYELCALWELRGALRAGNIWLRNSRHYANPESYLIPKEHWPEFRAEVCRQIQIQEAAPVRLQQLQKKLNELLARIDNRLPQTDRVRIEDDSLIITPLQAEEIPESGQLLRRIVDERLPRVDLTELLIEVDSWTNFTRSFEHASGKEPRTKTLLPSLYAAILAQACNLGLTRMAEVAELSYHRLSWCTNWYIREETLRHAVSEIVNFQHRQYLTHFWGDGMLSSSDGQRFPVTVKTQNAEAIPRYFGYGRGLTFYTWTSDEFSQYGSKVISATVRDATYVLDEILDNETDLPIMEHTTDTAGYTELVFALFDLLGLQFSPRIRDIGDQRLYRMNHTVICPRIKPILKGKINQEIILQQWDDLLRAAGSLKLGWVTASLLISKLQSYPRQNVLTRALQEYGRIIKTLFILHYAEDEEYRRRINSQLNKGESLHALRRFLFFGNEGKIWQQHLEVQSNQSGCLNLVTNAVITWNTVYMTAIIKQLETEGYCIKETDLAHFSPARYEHINPYGKYRFDVNQEFSIEKLRPFHKPQL